MLRRRFAEFTPPFTRAIRDYLVLSTENLYARKEIALLTRGHRHLLGTLLLTLGAPTLLCIEMVLTRLAYDKFALAGYTDALTK